MTTGEKARVKRLIRIAIKRERLHLATLIKKAEKMKSLGADEMAIYQTLKDTSLLSVNSLKLPWTVDMRAKIANDLELAHVGTVETKKILLASQKYAGDAWADLVLDELMKLDADQRKITFYGKQAKKKFEIRLAALNKVASRADYFLEQSDSITRVKILSLLVRAYSGFSEEIMASPIPQGLDELAVQEIKGSLAQMSSPFSDKAKAYYDLALSQVDKVADPALKAQLLTLLSSKDAPIKISFSQAVRPSASVRPTQEYLASISRLNSNPLDVDALRQIKTFYESSGSTRLAYYFRGRISSLEGSK
jgi:hypothetical protein